MIAEFERRAEQVTIMHPVNRTYEDPLHIHELIEIIYLSQGSVVSTVDGVTKSFCAPQLIVVFPFIPHSYRFTQANYYMIKVLPEYLPNYERYVSKQRPVSPFFQKSPKVIEDLIRTAYAEMKHPTELGWNIALGYINAIMGLIIRATQMVEVEPSDTKIFRRFLMFCSENYKTNIGIESVARGLGITPKYCSHMISKNMKINFRSYINTLRMDEAVNLLCHTNKPITYIALEVGYENQSTFNRLFTERFGTSPSDYRAQYQKR